MKLLCHAYRMAKTFFLQELFGLVIDKLRASQTLMGWVQQSRYITAQNFSFKTLKKLDKLFFFHLRHPHHLDKLHSSLRGVERYLEKIINKGAAASAMTRSVSIWQ